jgi:hypothetical protein
VAEEATIFNELRHHQRAADAQRPRAGPQSDLGNTPQDAPAGKISTPIILIARRVPAITPA